MSSRTIAVPGESLLIRLADIAKRADAGAIADEAATLAAKTSEGRFYLACVGQFKRGKSSLLDALLGEPLLPVGILPVTTIPTVVRYGGERRARVRFENGAWNSIDILTLETYVSEGKNPGNAKQVSGLEVFIPNDLLRDGMCLVDTPGISSVFEANTLTTRAFIPHIDAAVVVLGTDPPISRDELLLVETIRRQVRDLIFVLNKADRFSEAELAEAKAFSAATLAVSLGRTVEVLEVSAKERLDGAGVERDWPKLLDAVARLSAGGRWLVRESESRGATRLAQRLRTRLAEERRALEEPIEESERRIAEFDRYINEADQAILDMDVLLAAEQSRVVRVMRERQMRFLAVTTPLANGYLRIAVEGAGSNAWGPRHHRFVTNAALDAARNYLLPWLKQQEEFAQAEYNRVHDRFTAIAGTFVGAQYGAGVEDLPETDDEFTSGRDGDSSSRFYFTEILRIAQPASPFRYLANIVAGLSGRQETFLRNGERFLAYLLEVNASRVEAALEERLRQDRKRFGALLRARLSDAKASTQNALDRAKSTLALGQSSVAAELTRLRELDDEASELTISSAT